MKQYKNQLYLCLCLCMSSAAHADEYHYNNLLIGKNAIGLGGSFIAVADDLSTIHYNPAGLHQVNDGNMASINTFAWEKTNFTQVFGNGDDLERSSFSVIPGFFGIKTHSENWHLAAAFTVKDYGQERSDSQAIYDTPVQGGTPITRNQEFATIDIDNSAYEILFAGAQHINENWSFGLSLGLEYRTFQTDQGSGGVITTTVAPGVQINTGFEAIARFTDNNLVINPSLSVLYKQQALSLGAKISQPITLNRQHRFVSTVFVSGVDPTIPGIITSARFDEEACCKQKYPWNINLGTGYAKDNWQLSMDINYFDSLETNIETLDLVPVAILKNYQSLTNVAIGFSYSTDKDHAIRLGVFTDKTNAIIDTTIAFQRLEAIDLTGLSLSYESKLLDMPVTFGGYYKWGEGQVRISDVRAVESLTNIPLYPANNNNDISAAKKESFVLFFSVAF